MSVADERPEDVVAILGGIARSDASVGVRPLPPIDYDLIFIGAGVPPAG